MKSQDERIVLACAGNDAYCRHAAAMVLSALENTPRASFDIHFLHGPDLQPENAERFHRLVARHAPRARLTLQLIPDEWTEGLPLFRRMAPGAMRPVMWYRIFLPRLLPDADRVLYVDADAIVVDDLRPLWRLDLRGKALAAATQPFPEHIRDWPASIGLPSVDAYFNSGVMLLDLAYFRRHDVAERVFGHGRANAGRMEWADQDSLCVLLHDQRLEMDPRWNLLGSIVYSPDSPRIFTRKILDRAVRRPAIVHFEGRSKPWERQFGNPYAHLYFHYADRTGWPPHRIAIPRFERTVNFFVRQRWQRLVPLLKRVRDFRRRRPARG